LNQISNQTEVAVFTTAEIAHVLRVSNESVRREIRRGQLHAMQIGRQYRSTADDLIAWLGANRYNELFGHVQRVDEKLATASFGSKTKGVTRNRAKTTH
jgi:excisionase family DNA binding protein